ncbi:glycosyltransferase family 4 protein [Magnetospirillum molischianum]|uniref:Glycosyl transferase group 1 n=1 Tax=Magnetospirillum molischianum DSM 120 TaxID=1150626 RepID=H8FSN6_MAGML|nr:glycosyltransferase family 4 protein [Magnetospirillum molischianum]CCG41374.1 Glycosyl transferase group 1 [Magnetospirillum molischianum DSM 120]
MRIITVYNRYTVHGGEDEVFRREADVLEAAGHDVLRHTADNADLASVGRFRAVAGMIWNRRAAADMARLVRQHRAEVVHVHNFFAVLSPTILGAARASGAAVVQTLHNFRLFCTNSMLLRDRRPCEDCVGRGLAWPGIVHGCYRDSHSQSAAVAAMTGLHRLTGTWNRDVDRYIALTDHSARLFVRSGLPSDKVTVKPNFVEDRHDPSVVDSPRHGALLVGKMVEEKGVLLAAEAWGSLTTPLRFLGDGPLKAVVGGEGQKTQAEVARSMANAEFLVMPSLWYETFGLVVIEAFSAGLPVIAAGHGALADLIEDGVTGLLFRPGDAADLAAKARWAIANPEAMRAMGRRARDVFEQRYTPASNLPQLEDIYRQALTARAATL